MAIYLRDDHMYVGYLRIIDQYGNIVLHHAFERIHIEKKYCDIPQGILLIRGENITLMGELNPDINIDDHFEKVSADDIYKLQLEQTEARKELSKKRSELFAQRGLPDLLDFMFDDN